MRTFILLCLFIPSKLAFGNYLVVKYKSNQEPVYASAFADYLFGERVSLKIEYLDENYFRINLDQTKKKSILFNIKHKFSHPYYLNLSTTDTIELVETKKMIGIKYGKQENASIQYLELYLSNLYDQKIAAKTKLKLASITLDSLAGKQASSFEKTSLYFQYQLFHFLMLKEISIADKKMLLWSKALSSFPIDSNSAAMMGFFQVVNERLWFCAQHTSLNLPFLMIRNKEYLHKVLFHQNYFADSNYLAFSYFLKIKHILKNDAFIGDKTDLQTLIDSLQTSTKNSYVKSLYEKLKTNYFSKNEIPSNSAILSAYPFKGKEGKEVYLDSLNGKYILIDFWATWCKPCIAGFEKLKSIQKQYGDSLEIVSLNVDDEFSKMLRFLEKRPDLNWHFYYVGLNESVLSKFDVFAYPHYALLDNKGHLKIKRIEGIHDERFQNFLKNIRIKE
jgi:thiol-disulfide isomerase/thioredoxin